MKMRTATGLGKWKKVVGWVVNGQSVGVKRNGHVLIKLIEIFGNSLQT